MPHAQLTSPILRDVRQLLESGQLHQFEAADNRGEVAGTSVLSDGSVHSFSLDQEIRYERHRFASRIQSLLSRYAFSGDSITFS
jgi:hypothetical protein